MTYTYGIINWTEEEVENIDIHVRKMLNLYKMFQFRSDVDRLYTPRAMGGRGLMSAWDSFQCTAVRLAHYLENAGDEHIKKCAQFDKTTLYSIQKKGKNFLKQLYLLPLLTLKINLY